MKFEVTDARNPDDDDFILAKLRDYNAGFLARDFKLLRVFARNAEGAVIAGLLADTFWQYLEVHVLWVSEGHRNAGHASRLMHEAEDEARRRGCRHAFLDTFSFQAPSFYRGLGYQEFGQLEGFGGKYSRHYLHKQLV